MPEKTQNKMLVALVSPDPAGSSTTSNDPFEIHHLPDPSTGETRPYLLLTKQNNTRTLYEITAVQSQLNDYESFAVDNTIVSNGTLHTITPVDPLFWLLTDEPLTADKQQVQWQPLAQVTQKYNSVVTQCISKEQYQHVLAEYPMDDEIYCKFSVDKAVKWLALKQKAVQAVLLQQLERDQQKQRQESCHSCNNGRGAFQEGFNLGDDDDENTTPPEVDEAAEAKRAQQQRQKAIHESIQVVGNYLSAAWRSKFLESLELDVGVWEEPAKPATTAKRPRVSDEDDGTTTAMPRPVVVSQDDWNPAVVNEKAAQAKKKEKPRPITAGAKRLLKVSKKGMQKMSSFFSVEPKKK